MFKLLPCVVEIFDQASKKAPESVVAYELENGSVVLLGDGCSDYYYLTSDELINSLLFDAASVTIRPSDAAPRIWTAKELEESLEQSEREFGEYEALEEVRTLLA